LKIALSTWNRFHFFHLAREMERAGVLTQVFTNLPRYRVRHDQVPMEKIEANPFPAILRYAAMQKGLRLPNHLDRALTLWQDDAQQHFVARKIQPCDALIALSGAGLGGGRVVQERGGVFICERASTHIRWVQRMLGEEYERHGLAPPPFYEPLVEKELAEYEQSDVVVVPSAFVRDTFISEGVPGEKIVVNPYGVSLTAFGRDPVERSDGEFRVLWVGQISLRKGIPYLLEAFQRLRHPRKSLTLVGAVQADMRALLPNMPLDGVRLTGVATKPQVRAAMNQADVFCIASVEEGMAVVTGEAMACGRPVVATFNSGAGEIVTEGQEGFLVPARDVAELTDRLQRLADDPDLRERMGEAASIKAASLGGWAGYGGRYLDLVSRLTGKPRPDKPAE
jgi:starch synthase